MNDWRQKEEIFITYQQDENLNTQDALNAARDYLQDLRTAQCRCLSADFKVDNWLQFYCDQVDKILAQFCNRSLNAQNSALIAIGGYGRAELFPRSDVDILIVYEAPHNQCEYQKVRATIEECIAILWQLNLQITHSVRTVAQCLADAANDGDLLTSLLEKRFIWGKRQLLQQIDVVAAKPIAAGKFLQLKRDEQHRRDSKQENCGKLEPDVKTATGGLRDVHMINWLHRYLINDASTILHDDILSAEEDGDLRRARYFLHKIRYALHLLSNGKKDCLSFENQQKIAKLFGFCDQGQNLAVEQFMHAYYRHTFRVRRINRQAVNFMELCISDNQYYENLDDDFCLHNNKILLRHDASLKQKPHLLWKIFMHMVKRPEISAIHPRLARDIQLNRKKIINRAFRLNCARRREFLQLLNHRGNVAKQCRRMHRYGMIFRYIPAFWHIIGRMQYDLYHQYSVDQHTLNLLDYFEHFKAYDCADYPQAHAIINALRSPALLYLAAIFHDIGKGYHGDHSAIGAVIVEQFCLENEVINSKDRQLLTFLVRHHLSLSQTAQKKDISEAHVIEEFAAVVATQENLNYLYLLTIADISATNRSLWNSWRATLLYKLYCATSNALAHKNQIVLRQDLLTTLKNDALQLIAKNYAAHKVKQLWQLLPQDFFLQQNATQLAQKSAHLLDNWQRHSVFCSDENGINIFVSSTHSPQLTFALLAYYMEKSNLNIVEARLYSDINYIFSLQEYYVSNEQLPRNFARNLLKFLQTALLPPSLPARLESKELRHFNIATEIKIERDALDKRSILNLSCLDRHGLLSLISRTFLNYGIELAYAKIATFGEKAEDIFYIFDAPNAHVNNELITSLYHHLSSDN